MNSIIEDSSENLVAPSLLKIFINFAESYNVGIHGTVQQQILRFYNNMFYYSSKAGILNLMCYELIEYFTNGKKILKLKSP